MDIQSIKSRISIILSKGETFILDATLGAFHAYVLENPNYGGTVDAQRIQTAAIQRSAASAQASMDIFLSLAMIAYNNHRHGVENTSNLVEALRSHYIALFDQRYDEDISLIHSEKSRIYTTYNIEENYNYLTALSYVHASLPQLSMLSRDLASAVSTAVAQHMSQYSEDDSPNVYYSIRKNNKTGEFRRFNDEVRASEHIYSLGFADVAGKAFGYRPFYISTPFERAEIALDKEVINGSPLFGRAVGYGWENFNVEMQSGRTERRYPYAVNLRDSIRVVGAIYGADYVKNLLPLLDQVCAHIKINEHQELESDGAFEDQITLIYAWMWCETAPLRERIPLPNALASNINAKPQSIPQRSIEEFSWQNMPTRWISLKDKTTREFHDACVAGVGYGYKKLGNLNKELDPKLAGEKTLSWLAFINGVPQDGIDIIPRIAKERLIGINRRIMRHRNTYPAMRSLQLAFNQNILRFEHYKPWQVIDQTLFRHANGGVWTLEIEPNVYSTNEIKRLWRVLQDGYTSARYLLVLASLNTVSDTRAAAYSPGKAYAKNDVVLCGGEYYRCLETGHKLAPNQKEPLWKELAFQENHQPYIKGSEYSEGERVNLNGHTYQAQTSGIKNKSPEHKFTFWGKIRARNHEFGKFYSAMLHANASGLQKIEEGVFCDSGEMNSTLTHLSTAWRYPPSVKDDYSLRLTEREFPRMDVYLGYISENMIYNSPEMTVQVATIRRSSTDPLLNEGVPRWGNLITELDLQKEV
jgi:gamma-glutamylcyclotransferase (GGCT)/AIG2-like uncharacterized protein YtfP